MVRLLSRRAAMLLAAAFGFSLALIMMIGGAPQAVADEDPSAQPTATSLDNPDLTRKMSLTIHKYAMPEWDKDAYPNNGEEINSAPATAKALDGVHFTIKQVTDIDLTKASDWDQVKELKVVDGKVMSGSSAHTLGEAVDMKTANGGVAKFDDLKAGVYLVEEGADEGNNKITDKAAPFLVTVPFPAKNNGTPGWLYDVHVYPKNSVTEVDKVVDDTDAHKKGDTVKWTVSAIVPTLAEGRTNTRMEIKDSFDERLEYIQADTEVKLDGKAMQPSDYTITYAKPNVSVKLTKAGLLKLDKAAGKKLEVVFSTKVIALGNGDIPNQARVFINNPGKDGDNDGTPTNKPDTKWGKLVIKKFLLNHEDQLLKGAEFAVYLSEQDATAGTNAVTSGVTGDDGQLSFILKKGTYYVKETKAPAGYVLDEKVKTVQIRDDQSTDIVTTLKVPNTKQTVPNLPVTGASGQLLLIICGSSLMLLAVGTGILSVRRRRS